MVIRLHRSLAARFVAYGAVVMALGLPLGFGLADWLFLQGRRDASFEHHVEGQARFAAKELVASWKQDGPDPARLEELAEVFHARLRYLPWAAADRPASLAFQPLLREAKSRSHEGWRLFVGPPPGPPPPPLIWVRMERQGKPVGALSLRLLFPGPPQEPPAQQPLPPGTSVVGQPYRVPGELLSKSTSPSRHRPGPHHHGPWRGAAVMLWMVLVALLLAPPLWAWVLKPLRGMVATAERLGAGQLDEPVAVKRPDELGALESAFEGLRVRIQGMLQARERLLVDLSHELRGPLQRMGLVVPLLQRAGAPEALTKLLEAELKGSEALVADVLAWARAGHAPGDRKEALQLAALGQAQLELRQLRAEDQGIELLDELAPTYAWGDGAWLGRALGNLLDNAIRHAQKQVLLRVQSLPNGGAELAVIDDGPGLPEAELERAFEPFHRPDDSRSRETGGAGLGLAIVRAIARAHGGEARLSRSELGGLKATITLPPPPAAKGTSPLIGQPTA